MFSSSPRSSVAELIVYPRCRAASSIAAAALNGPYCDRAETSRPIDLERLVASARAALFGRQPTSSMTWRTCASVDALMFGCAVEHPRNRLPRDPGDARDIADRQGLAALAGLLARVRHVAPIAACVTGHAFAS